MKKQKSSPKLRLSFSLLNLWSKRMYEEAINMYLHLPLPQSLQLEEGKRYHKEWADTIIKTKLLNLGRSAFKFDAPRVEHSVTVSYNDKFDLKGIFDCLDEPTLWEFKTGTTSTVDYSRSYQIPFYFLIAEIEKIKIDKAYLYHFDQYKNDGELIIIHNNLSLVEDAKNLVDSIGPDILQYFEKHKIPLDK